MVSAKISTQILITLNYENVKDLIKEFETLRKQGIKLDPNDIWGKRTGFKVLNSLFSFVLSAQTSDSEKEIHAKELEFIVQDLDFARRRIFELEERIKKISND